MLQKATIVAIYNISSSDQFITTIAIAGISVVVFIIAMYVPPIIQGVVQGASVTGGMEAIRHGGQAASFAAGAAFLGAGAAMKGAQAASAARTGGSSMAGAALRGMASGVGDAGLAVASAAREKAISSPGAYTGSLHGLAYAKLDQSRQSGKPAPPPPPPPPPINDDK